jgi:hypothetical protein
LSNGSYEKPVTDLKKPGQLRAAFHASQQVSISWSTTAADTVGEEDPGQFVRQFLC